jgi:hypothetical protein
VEAFLEGNPSHRRTAEEERELAARPDMPETVLAKREKEGGGSERDQRGEGREGGRGARREGLGGG